MWEGSTRVCLSVAVCARLTKMGKNRARFSPVRTAGALCDWSSHAASKKGQRLEQVLELLRAVLSDVIPP